MMSAASENTLAEADSVLKADSPRSSRSAVSETVERFSSRWAFWASAVAGAVGFGNIWRFPYLIYDYGGAAFFIPYVLNLILVAMPVVVFEFGSGQLSQHGAVGATNAIHQRGRGAGWAFVACWHVLHFYPLLLAWTGIYLGNSFSKNLPWVVTKEEEDHCTSFSGDAAGCREQVLCSYDEDNEACFAPIVTKAIQFFQEGCNINGDPQGSVSRFSWEVMVANLAAFGAGFATIVGGAKIIGYVNMVNLVLPTVLMLVLVGVGASMEGSGDGIKAYIGKIDLSTLGSDVWQQALGQVLFSLGASQGGMMAYASHNDRRQNFYADTWVVAAGDTLYAFLAGFVVFAVAGFLSHDSGIPISELPLAGTGLIFQTYPVGLAHFGNPWTQILSISFFLVVWLLGFSSLLAQMEAVAVPIMEMGFIKRRGWGRLHICGGLALTGFIISFLYCLDMSNHLLDCFDYINANVLTVYFCASFAFVGGWLSSAEAQMEKCGRASWLTHAATWLGGGFFASLLGFLLPPDTGRIVGPVIGAVLMGGGAIAAILLSRREDEEGNRRSLGSRIYELTLGGVEDLRLGMNDIACRDTCCKIPLVWSILIKYVCPFFALFMLSLSVKDLYKMPDPDRPYAGWIFFISSALPFAVLGLSVAGFVFPQYMDFMLPLPTERARFEFLPDPSAPLEDVARRSEAVKETSFRGPLPGESPSDADWGERRSGPEEV
eukprot:Polyplicarium_translucidae@DN108_c0_g1_i1.p1